MPKRESAAATAVNGDFTDAVAERAYFRALQRGFVPGHELDDWLSAEREVAAQRMAKDRPVRKPAAPGKKRASAR